MQGETRTPEPDHPRGIAASKCRACHACARELGSEPGAARLLSEGGVVRAVEICSTCAGAPASRRDAARTAVSCTECGERAPATSRAVASGGQVSILCPRCAGDEPELPPTEPSPRPWRRRARPVGAGAACAIVALAFFGSLIAGDDSSAVQATPSLLDPAVGGESPPGRDVSELKVPPRERPQLHDLSYAGAGDEEIPLVWYHPLAGERELPSHAGRRFGADRPGPRPSECGEGHCGVDLGDRRGRVVHAVRPALVDRIVRSGQRLGGKYVRLYHPEGFFTYYMHLDVIRPALVPGMEVAAGEPLGLLGSTGIKHSPPHLHFAVTRLVESGAQHHIDPEPMLRQAVVLDEPAPFPDEPPRPQPRIASAARAPAGDAAAPPDDPAAGGEASAEVPIEPADGPETDEPETDEPEADQPDTGEDEGVDVAGALGLDAEGAGGRAVDAIGGP